MLRRLLRRLTALGAAFAASCSRFAVPGEGCIQSDIAPSKSVTVFMKATSDEFYEDMKSGMRDEAAKFGYPIDVWLISGPKQRRDEQLRAFLRRQRPNAAVVLVDASYPIYRRDLSEARSRNIPVFVADIPQTEAQQFVVSTITSNNDEGGTQAADLMCRNLSPERRSIAVLDVYKENIVGKNTVRVDVAPDVGDRVRAFSARIKVNCSGAHIVRDKNTGGTQAAARAATATLLSEYRDLGGIFAFNDVTALGAARAVEEAGLTNTVRIVGFDAIPEGREAVAGGRLSGDVRQYPDEIGRETIDQICRYANAKSSVSPKVMIPTTEIDEGNATQQ
jgi:ribose transport system substrate-binding protein